MKLQITISLEVSDKTAAQQIIDACKQEMPTAQVAGFITDKLD